MLNKNKFWKSLLGTSAEALISKQVAYTAQTTFPAFVTNSVEGEIGVFKTADGSAYSGSGAAAATDEVFIAMKRDGLIERTTPFTVGAVTISKAAYTAPASQVDTVSLSGTPVAGKFYEIRVMDLSPAYQPFPTWSYNYTAQAGDTLASVINNIVAAINDTTSLTNKNTDPVVTAVADQGVASVTVTAGGTGYTSAPTVAFSGGSGTGAAGYAVLTSGAVSGVVITNPGKGYTAAPTIAFTGGAGTGAAATATLGPDGTIILTANSGGPAFQTAFSNDTLNDLSASASHTTPPSWGNGTYDQVRELEYYSDVLKGLTTEYPQEGVRPEEYGDTSKFAASGSTYNIYYISGAVTEWSPLPVDQHIFKKQILLALPSSGTTPNTQIGTIFGA